MAAPSLLPEDFDDDDLELEEEFEEGEEYEEGYEETDIGDEDRSDRLDEVKEKAKEKFKEKQEQRKQEKEEAKKAETEKPPKQEPKPDNPELKQKKLDKVKAEADKVKSGEQKLSKATGKQAAKQGGKAGGKAIGKEISAVGKKGGKQAAKVAGKAAKQTAKAAAKIAKQAVKVAARAAAQAASTVALATVEFWGPVVAIILIIVVIIAVIFILFSFSGDGGKGPAIYPGTALQEQQSTFLLAMSGDKISQDTIVKDVIESELARYDRIKLNADIYNSALSAGVVEKKAELETKLSAILAEQDPVAREVLRVQIEDEMKAYESTLPFGRWIAEIAIDSKDKDNLKFCLITGAGAKVACASFVSTVLYLAGVPNAVVSTTLKIWINPPLRTIIGRPDKMSSSTYDESLLQPGDIIWWGDGTCSDVKYGGKLFDHVGFYIGNGQSVDTSSSSKTVKERPADLVRDDINCRLFNGAKRYGK